MMNRIECRIEFVGNAALKITPKRLTNYILPIHIVCSDYFLASRTF